MANKIECAHCGSDGTWELDRDDEDDIEALRKGFTHWCSRCLNKHIDPDPTAGDLLIEKYHFTVTDGGTVLKAPRPNGLRVEIDEAEIAVTDNVHKIPEMMGRAGATIAKVVQGLTDVAFASGLAAESAKAFGLAWHSAGIGKTVKVDIDGNNTHEITVIAAEAVEIGQMVYLDDDGKARVMRAAEEDDAVWDWGPGAVAFLPEGMTVTPPPAIASPPEAPEPPANVRMPSLMEAMGLQDTDEIETMLEDAFEKARLKADGIPTESGFKEKDESQPWRAARGALWLLKAGAASGAGAALVWAVKQLLKGSL